MHAANAGMVKTSPSCRGGPQDCVSRGALLRQLRIAPTLNINLPHDLFFTLFPSPDIRLNYGTPVWNQTGRLFLPLNFMVGWKPTEHP